MIAGAVSGIDLSDAGLMDSLCQCQHILVRGCVEMQATEEGVYFFVRKCIAYFRIMLSAPP